MLLVTIGQKFYAKVDLAPESTLGLNPRVLTPELQD
jgi:hypothetical protein